MRKFKAYVIKYSDVWVSAIKLSGKVTYAKTLFGAKIFKMPLALEDHQVVPVMVSESDRLKHEIVTFKRGDNVNVVRCMHCGQQREFVDGLTSDSYEKNEKFAIFMLDSKLCRVYNKEIVEE